MAYFWRCVFTRGLNGYRNLQWTKLCRFILSGLNSPHNIHLLNFFLNSIHGFGLVEKLFEGDIRRGREEVFTFAAFFAECRWVAWRSTKKRLRRRLYRKRVPTPDFPSLDSPRKEIFVGSKLNQGEPTRLGKRLFEWKKTIHRCKWSTFRPSLRNLWRPLRLRVETSTFRPANRRSTWGCYICITLHVRWRHDYVLHRWVSGLRLQHAPYKLH